MPNDGSKNLDMLLYDLHYNNTIFHPMPQERQVPPFQAAIRFMLTHSFGYTIVSVATANSRTLI